MQIYGASSPTCPSQLAPICQTSNICTKRINTQVGCITYVDSYSSCTYDAGVRDISKIVCYHQVLFAAVTKLQQFEEKKLIFLLLQGFIKLQISTHDILRMCAYVTGKLPVYTVCSQFKQYVGLVNLPHSLTCPRFPYSRLIT